MVDLEGDGAFQTADDGSQIGLQRFVARHRRWSADATASDDDNLVVLGLGLSVAASVEALSSAGLAWACWDRADSTHFGERCSGSAAICVVACGDEHFGCGVEPNPETLGASATYLLKTGAPSQPRQVRDESSDWSASCVVNMSHRREAIAGA